jgi:integrase
VAGAVQAPRAQHIRDVPDAQGRGGVLRDIEGHGVEHALALRNQYADAPPAPTLDAVAGDFLAWKSPRVRSDRTVVDYRRDYDRWISPRLGTMPITRITETHVQEWVDAMLTGGPDRRPAAPKSIGDRHALLHAIFAYACHPSRKIATHNPCTSTSMPKRPPHRPRGLSPAEWQAIYLALQNIDPDAADLTLFLVGSGWRWSEATALDTYGVEIHPTGMVHVNMRQVARRGADSRTRITPGAKTAAGLRRTALDADVSAMVARRVAAAKPGDLVFTAAAGRMWLYHHFRMRRWVPAIRAANLSRQPTPHELRHTQAGWLLMSKLASLPEIQRRLGHASITTTVGTYGSLVTDVDDAALAALAALRNPARELPAAIPGRIVSEDS